MAIAIIMQITSMMLFEIPVIMLITIMMPVTIAIIMQITSIMLFEIPVIMPITIMMLMTIAIVMSIIIMMLIEVPTIMLQPIMMLFKMYPPIMTFFEIPIIIHPPIRIFFKMPIIMHKAVMMLFVMIMLATVMAVITPTAMIVTIKSFMEAPVITFKSHPVTVFEMVRLFPKMVEKIEAIISIITLVVLPASKVMIVPSIATFVMMAMAVIYSAIFREGDFFYVGKSNDGSLTVFFQLNKVLAHFHKSSFDGIRMFILFKGISIWK
ncbi:hypothetical protein [Peribacillus tepidiphilus]|uniref:hypothetical protein n=1 Tax=Peribacillus tepidiphilus TaxID=2652445 RepID=UPI00129227D5|nr:hypothetical protein [Peribacillus tepidiphilus]